MSPNAGGGASCAVSQPMSTAVHRSPNKLRRSNSIFTLWVVWFCFLPTPIPLFLSLPVCRRSSWLGRGGGGAGKEPNLKDHKNDQSSIKETKLFIANHVVSACRYSKSTNWEMREAKYFRRAEVILGGEGYLTEDEFLYKIQTKFFRVFILAFTHSLIYCTTLPWDLYFFKFMQPSFQSTL